MRKSLARQFSVLFLLFALVTTVLGGVVAYINQTKAYRRETILDLEEVTRHVSSLVQKEGKEFKYILEWLEENDYQPNIPKEFREDLPVSKAAYLDYIEKNYDTMPTYEQMDDEAKRLYVRYRYEYWMTVFYDAIDEFQMSYVYMLTNVEDEEYTVRYVVDTSLWTIKAEDGTDVLLVGDKVYEDPKYHHYMWETWNAGVPLDAIDSLDNDFGYMYTYCYPLILDGEKVGMVCADTSVDRVNSEIFASVLRQVISSTIVLFVATVVLYQFLLNRILRRIGRLKKNVESYSDSKDPLIAENIKKNMGQDDELGRLSGKFAEIKALDFGAKFDAKFPINRISSTNNDSQQELLLIGGPSGTRTPDRPVMSRLL